MLLGDTRLGSLSAGFAARSVGRVGRWAGATTTAEADGKREDERARGMSVVMGEDHSLRFLNPTDPPHQDRGSRIVTKEALCREDPGVQITRTRFLIS